MTQTLERLKIPYIITGGMAVVIWGRPRFTADVDIVIELTVESLPRLADALENFCEKGMIDREVMKNVLAHGGEFNYIDGDSDVKVDFWVAKKTPLNQEQMVRAVRREAYGQTMSFISPEDLLLSKLLWIQKGSYRSMDDAVSVLQAQKESLDLGYISSRAISMGVEQELKTARGIKQTLR